MTKYSLLLMMMAALAILALQACQTNVDDYTLSAEISVEGLTPISVRLNGTQWAAIPADNMTTFTVTGKGKYANTIMLHSVRINGVSDSIKGESPEWWIPMIENHPNVIRGTWGEVEYLTTKPPYTIQFRVEPNSGNEARTIEFCFGALPESAAVILYQSAPNKTTTNQSHLRI